MTIEEYTAPPPSADYTPRPNASQEVARAKRARGDSEPSATAKVREVPRQWVVAALFGGFSLFVLALSWQLSQPARPLALTPVPTQAPTESASSLSVKRAQEGPQETISATIAPSRVIISAPPAEAVPAAPQTGRGLGAVATPEPPPAAPSYIENVGAQVRHSPRGGLCGPTGGDCAPGVPYGLDNSQYIANVGAQAPHKVR